MSEIIEYKSEIIMDTMKNEVLAKLGEGAWDALTEGIGVPDIEEEPKCGCRNMREFMRRLEGMTDADRAKNVLTHVRHGLTHAQFNWAKTKFEACGRNIDVFIENEHQEQLENFARLRDTGKDFYGQPITGEVFDFITTQPGMLSANRIGSQLHITAFPFDMVNYLKETDARKKRYYACHCPFARASILSEGGEVSKTMCYCSLGHAKVMWEAMLDTELNGDVVESALAGDMMCKYVLYLPDEISQP